KYLPHINPGYYEALDADLAVLYLKKGIVRVHPAPIDFARGVGPRILHSDRWATPGSLGYMDQLNGLFLRRYRLNPKGDRFVCLCEIVDHLPDLFLTFEAHLSQLLFIRTNLMESVRTIQLQ